MSQTTIVVASVAHRAPRSSPPRSAARVRLRRDGSSCSRARLTLNLVLASARVLSILLSIASLSITAPAAARAAAPVRRCRRGRTAGLLGSRSRVRSGSSGRRASAARAAETRAWRSVPKRDDVPRPRQRSPPHHHRAAPRRDPRQRRRVAEAAASSTVGVDGDATHHVADERDALESRLGCEVPATQPSARRSTTPPRHAAI